MYAIVMVIDDSNGLTSC